MSAQPFGPVLQRTFEIATRFLSENADAPVAATADLAALRRRLDMPLADNGLAATQVIEELAAGAAEGLIRSSGPRFFGWVIGGAVPAALAADWLTSTWDQNAGLFATAPAASVVEETAGRWLKELLGLPAAASFALVTGCQVAHVTCLAAARHAVLARRGWDVEQDGLAGAPSIRILTSTEKHGSIQRAARLLGIGQRAIVTLPSNDQGRLRVDSLAAALEQAPRTPTIVVLQAGDLNIGAFDDFETLVPLAHAAEAWVHVDGAFGLWAAASPALRRLVRGVDAADSWATDGHKWLNVPYDSGYAFVRDRVAHQAAMSYRAAYLTHDAEARDQMEWNPEWSRRARGFATYAALRELGRLGVAALIDRCCACARELVVGIGALAGAEAVWVSKINQGLVRFSDKRGGDSVADSDTYTNAVIAAINASGEAFFTGTTWRGRRAMRVSVCHWQTSEQDVQRVIEAVERVLLALSSSAPPTLTPDSLPQLSS